jgi:hypothetical protein
MRRASFRCDIQRSFVRVFDDNYDCNNVIERSAAVNCAVANLLVIPRRARYLPRLQFVCASHNGALPIEIIPTVIEQSKTLLNSTPHWGESLNRELSLNFKF